MIKKTHTTNILVFIIFTAFAFILISTLCYAEESEHRSTGEISRGKKWNSRWKREMNVHKSNRNGKSEIIALVQYMSGDTATGLGINITLDDTVVGGLGLGHNFSDHLSVNSSLYFGSMDITAGAFGMAAEGDTSLVSLNINIEYNISKNNLTPLFTGGAGFIKFDGEYDNGPEIKETDLSYNLGAGLRWDIANKFLLKTIYKVTWVKLEDADESMLFNGVNFSAGYMF